jgi:hypothetical protein
MHKYIVDTFGAFEDYRGFDELFDFYPNGLAGVIADYFEHHLTHPHEDAADRVFVDRIFQLYHDSQQFHSLYVNDVEQHHVELAITTATYLIGRTVEEFIKHHRTLLREFKLNSAAIELGTEWGYLLLEKQ